MKISLLLVCGALLVRCAPGQTLIHYYDFNGAGVTDLAGSADGTLNNGAALSGGKLVLDGINDTVSFGTKLVPTAGSFSVAFFAQALSLSGTYAEIISQGNSGAPGFYIGYDPSHNLRFGDNLMNTGLAFPGDAQVHHYALTMDGTNTRFYLDGLLTATFGSIGVAGSDDTLLGAQFTNLSEYFHGTIDELRIYTGALSAGQVAALAVVPEPAETVTGLALLALGFATIARRRDAPGNPLTGSVQSNVAAHIRKLDVG